VTVTPQMESLFPSIDSGDAGRVRALLGPYSPDMRGLSPSEYLKATTLEVDTYSCGKVRISNTLGEQGGDIIIFVPEPQGEDIRYKASMICLTDKGEIRALAMHQGERSANLDGLTPRADRVFVAQNAALVVAEVLRAPRENIRKLPD
jgi:hypothetical protein